jgi:hypothetical protein
MKVMSEPVPYSIISEKKPRAGAIELLSSIVYGTNGPLYQHVDVPQKIKNIIRPLFFTLEKEGKTIGTCTFLERDVRIGDRVYKGWYGRYFAITPENQGTIFGNLLLKNTRDYFEQTTDIPTVFYGYVDNENPRSKKLLKHIGLEVIRNFETLVFSRICPKKDKRVIKIAKTDKQEILVLLKEQYKNYAFVNFEPLFLDDNYFVLKNGNEIVAGIRANIVKWKIRYLPGISGKILMQLLPYVPFISRLFNPDDFRYIGFEGIYCKQGYEKELFILMESVCAELKLYTGMIWIDPESELHKKIKKAGNWGIMNKLKANIPVGIVAAFRNIPKQEQIKFRKHPAYISAFDLT